MSGDQRAGRWSTPPASTRRVPATGWWCGWCSTPAGRCRTRSAPVVASLPYGTAGVVTDGPVRADGFVWHEIDTDFGRGWAVGVYLAARGSGVVFAVGDTVVVDTNAVVLRSGPGRSYRDLVAVPRGKELTITDPPIRADGHDWYGVQNKDYGAGWAAGTYLSPA